MKPGAEFTKIVDYAHKLRLVGTPMASTLKQTLACVRKCYGG